MKKGFLLITILLFATNTVYAQVDEACPTTMPLLQAYESNYKEEQENRGVYGVIEYDVYGNAIRVVEHYPFGYIANVVYSYYPVAYNIGNCSFEPILQKEIGTVTNNNNEVVFEYSVDYDTDKNIVSKENSGSAFILFFLKLVSTVLGIDISEEEKEEILERF